MPGLFFQVSFWPRHSAVLNVEVVNIRKVTHAGIRALGFFLTPRGEIDCIVMYSSDIDGGL